MTGLGVRSQSDSRSRATTCESRNPVTAIWSDLKSAKGEEVGRKWLSKEGGPARADGGLRWSSLDGSLACSRGCVCFDPRDSWIIRRERESTAVLGPGLEKGGMERQEVEEVSMEECRRSDDAAPPTKGFAVWTYIYS